MKGKVKSFSRIKGYGFLLCEDIEHDIFFHYSEIQQSGFKFLKQGDIVNFDYDRNNRQAVNIVKTYN